MNIRLIRNCAVSAAILLAALPVFGKTPDLTAKDSPENAIWLESFDLIHTMWQAFEIPHVGRSLFGGPITLKGKVYPHGVGTHADSEMKIALNGSAERFISMVGLDDEITQDGTVIFEVWVDGKKVADTGVMRPGDEPRLISVDLNGAHEMELKVGNANGKIDSDHADWGGAMIILKPGAKDRPQALIHPIIVPAKIASSVPDAKPAIHGPKVVGTTPGRPFLYKVPATGEGPLAYTAKNLPDRLVLDSKTGIITGSLKNAGEYDATIIVSGPKGKAESNLKIIGGTHKLAQTPPMGWLSWNIWTESVDDKKVREAADMLVKTGLASHGYEYVIIDDSWEGTRDASGEIQPNSKFPDMKALADYIHSKGLKFGIYSSPGPKTCAQYEGSYGHEEQDARTYAKWGVDYLKYDWCSYEKISKDKSLPELKKPYKVMGDALDKCGRDMVYSLCQYGMGDVWKWGPEVGANLWRTAFDIRDGWWSVATIGFGQKYSDWAGPGHWNDPDMLVVGKFGETTKLTQNEQVAHISLWSLLAAPMLISADMSSFDQWTIDLLSNDEVIGVDQDPLGKAAKRVAQNGETEIWSRPLFDGTIAVGLFNRSSENAKVTAKWADLGISGTQPVRDLWLRKDLTPANDSFTTTVPAHGAVFVKIGK